MGRRDALCRPSGDVTGDEAMIPQPSGSAPTWTSLTWTRMFRPRGGILRRRRGLDEGERALVAMVVARQAGALRRAEDYARTAAGLAADPFAIALLLEEGFPSPLTGRIGAIATAAGALSAPEPCFGRAELRRLEAQGIDAEELEDIVATVAAVRGALVGPEPRMVS